MRKLKAFARFDGTGKIVPSSVIYRRRKPLIGNFKQIQDPYSESCCNIPVGLEIQDLGGGSSAEYAKISFYLTNVETGYTLFAANWSNIPTQVELPAGNYFLKVCRESLAVNPLIDCVVTFNSLAGSFPISVPTTVDCATVTASLIAPAGQIVLTLTPTP